VFAVTIAGVKEERRRRVGTGEGPIIPDISQHPPGAVFSFGQHRHGRVVAVEALGNEHVIPDQFNQRRQSCSAGADPVRKVDTSSSTLSRA
jgi:hypothetical protein